MASIQSYAEVNGTRLYYEAAGSGGPVIFIHGFGADSRVWDAQFMTFAAHFLAVRYDLRGHGKSAMPGFERYSHAEDLKALLDHLNLPQAALVGQSLGGGIALDFALAFPEKAVSLVLVDSTISGYPWSDEWGESWAPIYSEFARSGGSASLPLLLAHPIFAPGLRQPAMKARLAEILADYSGWHILNQDQVIEADPPAIQRLNQVQARTLILTGQLDLPDFQAMSKVLANEIPNVHRIELADVGHVSMMEAPEKFNQAVMSFLQMQAGYPFTASG